MTTRTPRKPSTARKRPGGRRPGAGRKSAITAPLHLADGTVTTVADRIVALINQGAYVERAARSATVPRGTFYGWLDTAQRTRERIALKGERAAEVTDHERACMDLAERVEQAEADWEHTALAALDRIAHGRVELTKTVEVWEPASDDKGTMVLVERRTTVTGLAPNPQVIMWMLTRKFPDRYQLVPNRGDGTPVPDAEPVDLSPEAITEMLNDLDAYVAEFDIVG